MNKKAPDISEAFFNTFKQNMNRKLISQYSILKSTFLQPLHSPLQIRAKGDPYLL
jgi:hypothetical protein